MKINGWNIERDPMRLLDEGTNLVPDEKAARKQGEDILQVTRDDRTLDLGWYHDRYRVMLIEGSNWTTPIAEVETLDLISAVRAFRNILV